MEVFSVKSPTFDFPVASPIGFLAIVTPPDAISERNPLESLLFSAFSGRTLQRFDSI